MNKIFPSLDHLPSEIIEQILSLPSISYIDICRISTLSPLFNCITKSNKLWYIKYSQTWPTMINYLNPVSTDWKNEFQRRIEFRRGIIKELHEMSKDFYHLDNVSNDSFHTFKDVCDNHPFTDYILVEELGRIINDSNRHSNLTIKYYAEKALIYVRHTMLDTIWRTFLEEPNPSLLKGACLIQQWCNPSNIDCTKEVSKKVNLIIEMVFNEIKTVCPSHPVIKKGYSGVHDDIGEILESSLWSPYQCKVILNCINSVLYEKLGFCCYQYMLQFDNAYIEKVLDKKGGIITTVSILYETIASQLGVHLIPVNFPGPFLLKWLEHPELIGSPVAWTYIDIHSKGMFKKEDELQQDESQFPGIDNFVQSWLEPASALKIFARICWNLVEFGRRHDESGEGLSCLCNSLELLSILCPEDLEHKLLLARVYMHLCVNITRVISLLQEIAENDPISTGIVSHMYRTAITTLESQRIKKDNRKIKCQKRTDEDCLNVEFAVGMLMKHKKYNYRCVIYGWDPVCTASEDWIKQMGVNKLKNKGDQPFYHVLVADGTNRYAAQENLKIDIMPEPINHMEIGRYFESFNGCYYFPNEQKRIEYPDDVDKRESFLLEWV